MTRPTAGPLAAALLLAGCLLGGCGVRPSGVVYAGEAPVATAPASPTAQVYFLVENRLVAAERPVSPWDAQRVYDELLRGPTGPERSKGLRTDLAGVRQISVHELGSRMLFIEVLPRLVKLSPGAYLQLYCTGAVLPERPVVKLSYAGVPGSYPPVQCPGQGEAVGPAQVPPG